MSPERLTQVRCVVQADNIKTAQFKLVVRAARRFAGLRGRKSW